MTARILDGAALARTLLAQLRAEVQGLQQSSLNPGLAAVQVGDSPASRVYVRNKMRACQEVGLHSETHQLPADCSEQQLLDCVARLNADEKVHGIIVQLPLPRGVDTMRVVQSVAIEKDVDGFNWRNLGAIVDAHPQLVPCTPLGVMKMLEHEAIPLEGRHAVVIGRSSIVGKPMALLLMAAGATVTVCNSKTLDLARHTRDADIVIAAAGRARLVTGAMLKPGAVVVDVGINRLPDGKLAGDVDFASAREVAGWISPVPGGVGPMTVAMLIHNTVTAARRIAGR
ncbi:MAG TPA: bifunctional methylenetetrahydrofolate dehydrogenase/methenyltetrahydrofolate cyclohydrolase FolD [Burkholderiales bacterium]|nr:bifunctional methylenetetrahydrofolate dehydrogenase/methenyltetrahydrofolate cyclohydrolase FolD [Burkholderiales bacterium]